MHALFFIKVNYYRFLLKISHFERVQVIFELDGISFTIVFIS